LTRFSVNTQRPWWHATESIIVVVLLALAGYVAYMTGRKEGAVEYAAVVAERNRLRNIEQHIQAENSAFRERIALLDRARQIDSKAYSKIDASLKAQQDEVLSLREEVAFYRGIVTSPVTDRRLSINSLEIQPRGTAGGNYRFQVVLTRLFKSDKVVAGSLSLIISGEVNGRRAQDSSVPLSEHRTQGIDFHFKHFTRIGGRISLPPDFVPQRVRVSVVTAEKNRTERIERAFDWPLPIG